MQSHNNPNQIFDFTNGFVFTYVDNKDWICKSIPIARKSTMKEKPFLKVVEEIEGVYKKLYDRCLVNAAKDITRYLIGTG